MTTEKLLDKIPKSVVMELDEVIKMYHIDNHYRLSHFLSQCAHESANFTAIRENLNYSQVGLLKVFPKYFDQGSSRAYARKPEQIANLVYGNRMGNADKNSGEGYKFRGRGFIQLTGKNAYKAFGDYIGVDLLANPDLVATKYPLTSAGWFFEKKKIWTICDKGVSDEICKDVTKMVNGGYNGLTDRINKLNVFSKLLS